MLNDLPREKLKFIIEEYGRSAIRDSNRCRELLRGLAPEHLRETNLLMLVLTEGFVWELTSENLELLSQRLHDEFGIQEEFAFWAVESWALTFDLIKFPMVKKITEEDVIETPQKEIYYPEILATAISPIQKIELVEPITEKIRLEEHEEFWKIAEEKYFSPEYEIERKKAWVEFETAFENETTVTGRIEKKINGGFNVNLGYFHAFLPNSLVVESLVCDDFIFDYSILKFKIIEMDSKNIVVSQHSLERETFFKTVKEGSVITGKVTSIKGVHTVFDLGGVNASLCIDDVKIGEEIKISILSIDAKTQKVRIKKARTQQIDELWQDVLFRYPVGMIFIGTVITKVDYGCFVEIEKGIDGLLHISEMTNIDSIKVDDKLKLMVFKIDELNRKISLSEIRIPI